MEDYKKPIGYVASPYSKGDSAINARFQCKVFDKIMNDNFLLPYIPLWSHFQHTIFPRNYNDWIEYDNDIIKSIPMKWILRLNVTNYEMNYYENKSSGANNEVKLVKELYPEAKVVVQTFDEHWKQALKRLYKKMEVI